VAVPQNTIPKIRQKVGDVEEEACPQVCHGELVSRQNQDSSWSQVAGRKQIKEIEQSGRKGGLTSGG
jgi:hypothetical protein